MNRPFNKVWKETFIISLSFIIVGCFMIYRPSKSLDVFSNIVGAFLLLLAALAFYKHYKMQKSFTFDLVYAIVCAVMAFILFIRNDIVAGLIPVVLGLVMILNSLFKIQYIFELKKSGMDKWWISLVLALLKVGMGILLIVNPFAGKDMLATAIGITIIIFAICDLVDLIFIKYILNKSIDGEEEVTTVDACIENEEVKQIEE